ncbi:MAG: DUF6484 domain-containing protein [Yoonia sp.]|uniref:DUF6484 domain-containing protein n=1 Tax=Yoonia sp. TaxID=2212373 RepID=UPI0032666FE9
MNPSDVKIGDVKLDGVVIGMVMDVTKDGIQVVFPGNPSEEAIPARATVPLSTRDIGAEVALIFEQGNPGAPIIMGRLLRPGDGMDDPDDGTTELDMAPAPMRVSVDDEAEEIVDITGKEQVVIRCGRASITLTKAGKILLRGAYISSRSSGANRIKGGSIHLN